MPPLTAQTMINRVHALLGQAPSDSTNYVSSAQILDYLNEGIDVMCVVGKVYDVARDASTGSSGGYITLSSTLEANTGSSSDVYVVDVENVLYNGVALNRIDRKDAGKLWQTSTTPSPGDGLWWYQYGDYIYILPTINSQVTYTVQFWARPQGSLVTDTPTGQNYAVPPFDSKYHHQLVNYAAWRGKQQYQQHQEAGLSFLQTFAQSLNVDLAAVMGFLGVKS